MISEISRRPAIAPIKIRPLGTPCMSVSPLVVVVDVVVVDVDVAVDTSIHTERYCPFEQVAITVRLSPIMAGTVKFVI